MVRALWAMTTAFRCQSKQRIHDRFGQMAAFLDPWHKAKAEPHLDGGQNSTNGNGFAEEC
jgi:hypothetical protein